MKIQCDVCEKQEASVFCAADEAALCERCDHRVHHANKLVTKHRRFSLLRPSSKEAPLCDICQVRRAFLFCKEDRAILCGECDIPIHKSNEHAQRHNRFLLTGVRISPSSTPYHNPSPLSSSSSKPNSEYSNSGNGYSYDHHRPSNHSHSCNSNMSKATSSATNYNQITEESSVSTSNTTPDYLLESVPGWRLEDLLDPNYAEYSDSFESKPTSDLFSTFSSTIYNSVTNQYLTFDNERNLTPVNSSQQVEKESMGSFGTADEHSRMWEFPHQGPDVAYPSSMRE